MAVVRMKQHISGSRDGLEWPYAGGTVRVPDTEAAELIAAGYAEEVTRGEAIAHGDEFAVEASDDTAAEDGDEAATGRPKRRRA